MFLSLLYYCQAEDFLFKFEDYLFIIKANLSGAI